MGTFVEDKRNSSCILGMIVRGAVSSLVKFRLPGDTFEVCYYFDSLNKRRIHIFLLK